MRPNFLVIGAMKAGTTSLHRELGTHPDVFMSERKELHFFVAEKNWGRGTTWYEEHFAGAEGHRAIGECSPSYSQADVFEGVADRVVATLPDVRIVYLLREPVDRMRSMYVHQVAAGREQRPIEIALRDDPHYLHSSRYAWQLEHYLRVVPTNRIHIATFEGLRDDRAAVMRAMHHFLGVRPTAIDHPPVHAGAASDRRARRPIAGSLAHVPGYRSIVDRVPPRLRRAGNRVLRARQTPEATMSPALRAELVDRLRPDVERLRELLGTGAPHWDLLEPPRRDRADR